MSVTKEELLAQLLTFRRERDWEQFHTPKNLAASIAIEAAELLELFQWQRDGEVLPPEKETEAPRTTSFSSTWSDTSPTLVGWLSRSTTRS